MNIQSFTTSEITSDTTLTKSPFSLPIAEGQTGIIEVEYFAKASNGKRITGKKRGVFTTISGLATILGVAVDPYLEKDSTGFADAAVDFSISTNTVTVTITSVTGMGNTNWGINIKYSLL
jgi:hypothetical protein